MSELFPLLLLTRENVSASGESAVVNWLSGFEPATFTCELEQVDGTDSDRIAVVVRTGGWPASDGRIYGESAEFLSVLGLGRSTKTIWAGAESRQISWDVFGGTWSFSVWLEASPMRSGELSSALADNQLKELL